MFQTDSSYVKSLKGFATFAYLISKVPGNFRDFGLLKTYHYTETIWLASYQSRTLLLYIPSPIHLTNLFRRQLSTLQIGCGRSSITIVAQLW
ncbi:hypothetical protein VTL71DRAFT_8264, partial [Oculimacula yallundae]